MDITAFIQTISGEHEEQLTMMTSETFARRFSRSWLNCNLKQNKIM